MYNSPIHTIWFNGAGVGREKGWKNKLKRKRKPFLLIFLGLGSGAA